MESHSTTYHTRISKNHKVSARANAHVLSTEAYSPMIYVGGIPIPSSEEHIHGHD
jgi:hypothetical protein